MDQSISQQGYPGAEFEGATWADAVGGIFGCMTALIFLAIFIVVLVLLYNAQKAVPVQHRKMEPGLIWLLLIPLFNLVWNFFVFLRVPESYQSYFASLGRPEVGQTEKNLGLAYAILAVCSIIPCVSFITGPAALIVLVLFLVRILGLKKQIEAAEGTIPPVPPAPPVG